VRNADKIIVIDNGVVVEQGNHETLIKRKAIYYALVQAQTFDNLSEDEHLKTIDSSPFIGKNTIYLISVLYLCFLFRRS